MNQVLKYLKLVKIKSLTAVLLIVALWIVSVIAIMRLLGREIPNRKVTDNVSQKQVLVEEESVVIDVVEKVSPSVVSIAVENRQILEPFFGLPQTEKQSGIGTGFVVSSDGLILTNKHVVSNTQEKYIAIIRNGEAERKLEISDINLDPFNDLAIVKVAASDLKPVEMGDSDKLKVGQKVIAIGNALGRFENTVTTGVVSGLGRGVSPVDPTTGLAERLEDLIQTDAAINPGNSGGPLVNINGEVIGINTAIAGGAQNIGFAIPINDVKGLVNGVLSTGQLKQPYLGVRYVALTDDLAYQNNLDVTRGAYIVPSNDNSGVVSNSPAQKAGLKEKDIITKVNDISIDDKTSLTSALSQFKVGDSIKLTVVRDEKTITVNVTLEEAPNQ